MKVTREALHAGSWYTDDGDKLSKQLERWMSVATVGDDREATTLPVKGARVIIAPHAGYSYSGPTAAYAYKSLDTSSVRRVFILGPSHHVYMSNCSVSRCTEYATPLGNLVVDEKVHTELKNTGDFLEMNKATDEEEHSIEMHLPFIYKTFQKVVDNITIVPVLVGNLTDEKQEAYGRIFAPYLADPKNAFVISSDFCHWGGRFRYKHYRAGHGKSAVSITDAEERPIPIYESIELIDREGMGLIESLDRQGFENYLSKTKNTICGRNPIGVLLAAVDELMRTRENASPLSTEGGGSGGVRSSRKRSHVEEPVLRFVRYAQSSKAKTERDSSVSYASAYLVI